METLTITLVLLIIIIILFILFNKYNSNSVSIKSSSIKKLEIINGYKKQIKIAIKSANGNKNLIIQKRKELLKQFNSELSRNIFFDKDEVKKVIGELATYS